MANLFDLIAGIVPAPAITATVAALTEVTSAPAANDPQPASEPLGFILTAATANPEWRHARDRYMNHLMACRACHAPTSRYCQTGAELRAVYNATPWS